MNYAVVRTMFGDYWVGKTNLEPNGGVFATWGEAVDVALDLAYDREENRLELEEALEEDAETICKEMERWIVT